MSSSSSSLHVYIHKHDCQWDSCPLYTEKLSMDYSEKKISICSITKNKVELIWTEISPTGQLKSDFGKNNYGLVDFSTMDRDTQNISTMDRDTQNISTMDRETKLKITLLTTEAVISNLYPTSKINQNW